MQREHSATAGRSLQSTASKPKSETVTTTIRTIETSPAKWSEFESDDVQVEGACCNFTPAKFQFDLLPSSSSSTRFHPKWAWFAESQCSTVMGVVALLWS